MASTIAPDQDPYDGDVLRVWGPPGTGKTRYLAERVRSTVKQYGPDSLLIASFSTTAAKEIGGRFAADGAGLRPPDSAIGTLHSHAFRALGNPNVALDTKILGDWNEQVSPELNITPSVRGGGPSGDSGALGVDPEMARTGDELIGALDRLRAARIDPEDWPANVREFAGKWSAWKRDAAACDFTDMIEGALAMAAEGTPAPGRPDYLVIDEAQDMTPLEVGLALAWGSHAKRLVVGMDDDQAINRWRGGDPAPLLNLHGEGVTDHVLDRSYRVPEAVRAVAEQWVRRLSLRREKVYHSRVTEDGAVVPGIARRVERKLKDMSLIKDMVEETERGRTVMVIASCNYLLEELIGNLRAEGVPFHNPYRPAEQRWNPLGPPTRDGSTSTVDRVRAFLALSERDWTGADVQAWIELIKLSNAGMVRGAKTAAARFEPNAIIPFEEIAALFKDEEMLSLAVEPNLEFLERNLLSSKSDVARYPLQVARSHGAQALDVQPMITVGTIHSVKGAASDVVYVSPDISGAAVKSMSTRDGVDDAVRLFYVAMTRAYEELRVLAPATNRHMVTAEIIPPELEVFA
jgi:superfamily I DNA/RNA helicase